MLDLFDVYGIFFCDMFARIGIGHMSTMTWGLRGEFSAISS